MIDKYRAIFLTPMGLEVLADILEMCHFGCTLDPDNKVMVSEHNLGVVILSKCGIFSKGTKDSVIMALATVIPDTTTNKGEYEDGDNLS
jgi:hypothetical protein